MAHHRARPPSPEGGWTQGSLSQGSAVGPGPGYPRRPATAPARPGGGGGGGGEKGPEEGPESPKGLLPNGLPPGLPRGWAMRPGLL